MKQTRIVMGMPASVEIIDPEVTGSIFAKVFDYFVYVDRKFSPFKPQSEVSLINSQEILPKDYSSDMRLIMRLAQQTKLETRGFFDIAYQGKIDPSGIVKGWAIYEAAKLIRVAGYENFYLDVGGDIQAFGKNASGKKWRIGIRHPFKKTEIVKVLEVENEGVATSGTYERGLHIYNPKNGQLADEIASLTVVGPNVYEADRYATAAFAMGPAGISFIAGLSSFAGYMIDKSGRGISTSGLARYIPKT